MITKFENFFSTLAPLMMDDVDTDQIIPARYLTGTGKEGYGQYLFEDLRFDEQHSPRQDFVLNKPEYKNAQILLAHRNFGCGSSREHAPWALAGYGFRAVIAISFADIFKNNAYKNGLLPTELSADVVDQMHADVTRDPTSEAGINLEKQTVTWLEREYYFDVNPFSKKCLLEGLDDIGYTLSFEPQIGAYEAWQVMGPLTVRQRVV